MKRFNDFNDVNVFSQRKGKSSHIYTVSLDPGFKVYDEKTFRVKKGTLDISHSEDYPETLEIREWNPNKSKLGAAISLKAKIPGLFYGAKVLYLGCSYGTTVSHVSDVVGKGGIVFGLDFAPVVMKKFYFLSQRRKNIIPIMADANKPEEYRIIVPKVDVLFEDVAQKNQVEIFIKNAKSYLKSRGIGMLAVKSRSIDVAKRPDVIYKEIRSVLKKHAEIVDFVRLDRFEKDHGFFVLRF